MFRSLFFPNPFWERPSHLTEPKHWSQLPTIVMKKTWNPQKHSIFALSSSLRSFNASLLTIAHRLVTVADYDKALEPVSSVGWPWVFLVVLFFWVVLFFFGWFFFCDFLVFCVLFDVFCVCLGVFLDFHLCFWWCFGVWFFLEASYQLQSTRNRLLGSTVGFS